MKSQLIESIDFKYIKKSNAYGINFNYPQLNNRILLKRISEPNTNSIVYLGKDNKLILVMIKHGEYESNGRISNFWTWYYLNDDLIINGEDCGYGNFFIPKEKFKVEIKYKINVESI